MWKCLINIFSELCVIKGLDFLINRNADIVYI